MRPLHAKPRLLQLPDEVLLQILTYLPDASTLFEIARIVDERILNRSAWDQLRKGVTSHPLQLQRLIRLVISERCGNVPKSNALGGHLVDNLKSLKPLPPLTASQWLQLNLGRPTPFRQRSPPFLILDSVHDSAVMLPKMNTLSSDMEILISSFIQFDFTGCMQK